MLCFPFQIPMFWTCSFRCMFQTPDFPTFVFCDSRYMFHVPICHFSLFPFACIMFHLFTVLRLRSFLLHLILLSSRLCSQFPFVSRPVSSELLVYISLTLVPSSLRNNITILTHTPPGSSECWIPTQLRPSLSSYLNPLCSGTRSGVIS